MSSTLRIEIFPVGLDATVDFYVDVLGFALLRDERADLGYVALVRGEVRVGAAADLTYPIGPTATPGRRGDRP